MQEPSPAFVAKQEDAHLAILPKTVFQSANNHSCFATGVRNTHDDFEGPEPSQKLFSIKTKVFVLAIALAATVIYWLQFLTLGQVRFRKIIAFVDKP